MGDRHAQRRPLRNVPGERRIAPLDREAHPAVLETQRRVASQGAGQQPSFGQHLEAVADAQHQAAARGVLAHRAHDRAEARDGARAQVVAVGEAARQDHRIGAVQVRVSSCHTSSASGAGQLRRVQRVAVAVRAREDDHGDLHRGLTRARSPSASMSGLARKSAASVSITAARRRLIGRFDRQLDPPPDAHATDVIDAPSWGSAASTARPCGSRMPSRGMIETAKRKVRHSPARRSLAR